ncbi:MAG: beta galactosidase jelly roll domain-containing protein [Bacteroidota bacterium]|nr:beta galactosidase jelly roll domain-containing protein [Bacteroidota bacterium]
MLRIISWALLMALLLPCAGVAQNGKVTQVALRKFYLQSSGVVQANGKTLSQPGYHSKNYWYPVEVPCTVLSGLVANKLYPDPYTGMNNMEIPDASDSFNNEYHLGKYSHIPGEPNPWKKPYWYRTTFSVPAADKGRHFQLIFKGINYRAAVWLNGQQVADSSEMAGMFAQYFLDVTGKVVPGKENVLAVEIYPLDFPGLPAHPQLNALGDFYANGGPTGDIGKNVTMLSSVGWDWIPAVRDRNMGIWQPVYLRTTGQVVLKRPHLITQLPLEPDTTVAHLSLSLDLSNYGPRVQNGRLRITISPENFKGESIQFTKALSLDKAASKKITLTPKETGAFTLRHPHLWWPNGYGMPNLYQIKIEYIIGNVVSDDTSFAFGIRTVSSRTATVNGWVRRDFYVNGKRIHLVGGAWVPDMMLNRNYERYDEELQLCRNANLNLIRIWGGGLGETDDFYELADKYGLLVWQDFWITGDTNGGFKGSADWPLESSVFIKNVQSTIRRIRNHPSLLVWTGGNEGHARKELYEAMRNNVATLDGTRPFIPCSSGFSRTPADWGKSWPDNQPSGVYSGGPYSWQDAARYFELVDRGRDWVFKDETGIPSQPPYNTLSKIIPDLIPDPALPYPLNNSWGYHDACSGNGKYDLYYKAMETRYGAPTDLKDFSDKMQLVNANGYRAIFEAAAHKLNETGGVMLWKLNAAFPSVIWQIYDYYLEPNSGYYFIQRACEPVHIQLNLDDSSVAIVNRSYKNFPSLRYQVQLVTLQGATLLKKEGITSLDTTQAREILSVKEALKNQQGISFLILQLRDQKGNLLSHNTYWMSPDHDFTGLKGMAESKVEIKVLHHQDMGSDQKWTVEFINHSSQLAFFLNPQVIQGGEEVLPSYWSDNYFSIPSEQNLTVTVRCPSRLLKKGHVKLRLEGWNLGTSNTNLNY